MARKFTRRLIFPHTHFSRNLSFFPKHHSLMAKDEAVKNKLSSVVFECPHVPGALTGAISLFQRFDLNIRRIESKPSKINPNAYEIHLDVEAEEADVRLQKLLGSSDQMFLKEAKTVPWFPMSLPDLDKFSTKTLDAGADLESDHPGFHDRQYRERRAAIVENAQVYKFGKEIPRVDYSKEENETWGKVYNRLKQLYPTHACKEFNSILPLMEQNCGYSDQSIPQLEDISQYLQRTTGFRLRPVSGLLSARDFLNALAFRTFFSTQYIRHGSKPFYTPEPDCCHELMGHVPMFVDPNFADFSQTIGIASLGATDADIKRLASVYWFSVEFGLLQENGKVKAYGAGLLSSFGELEYSCGRNQDGFPKLRRWDPLVAAETQYPITTFQPKYFVAESLEDAKERVKQFCENEVSKSFNITFDALTNSVSVDRNVAPVLRSLEEF